MPNIFIRLRKIFLDINIKKEVKKIRKVENSYTILSLGTYCLPRVIANFSRLKKRKGEGEKTCPFDLAFFDDFEKIIHLIKTEFKDFFDGVQYGELYSNPQINAVFNHDGGLTPDEFVSVYKERIKNFYEYITNKTTHKFFVIASLNPVSEKELSELFEVLNSYMREDEFTVILINQSRQENTIRHKSLYVIEMSKYNEEWKRIDKDNCWVNAIRKRNSLDAQIIYYEIVKQMISIMKKMLDIR